MDDRLQSYPYITINLIMTQDQILDELKSKSDEKMLRHHQRSGATGVFYGVKMGDIRALARKLKNGHDLGRSLWETGVLEARMLAILLMKPALLPLDEVDRMVRSEYYPWAADWLQSYIIKLHPDKETLRLAWMQDNDIMAARAGWSLTAGRVVGSPDGIDIQALLDRIEHSMPGAHPSVQWTMNSTLAQIGIHHPSFRKLAIEIGERLGIYRDFPVSKGCTSPFAPIWIREMVRRNESLGKSSGV
jgi:3-methyladenine DNA glycosylase AlkD